MTYLNSLGVSPYALAAMTDGPMLMSLSPDGDNPAPEPAPVPAPAPEPKPALAPKPAADPSPSPAPAPSEPTDAEKNRQGYEQRQQQTAVEKLQKELDGYKRREDEARKEKLSAEERLKEERDEAVKRVTKLEAEALQNKIAAEFKLPPTLAVRLIGSDEESLRADAEELAKLVTTKAGSGVDPARDGGGSVKTYTREDLRLDPALARSPELRAGMKNGSIKIV